MEVKYDKSPPLFHPLMPLAPHQLPTIERNATSKSRNEKQFLLKISVRRSLFFNHFQLDINEALLLIPESANRMLSKGVSASLSSFSMH
jgi:hypothetical protein